MYKTRDNKKEKSILVGLIHNSTKKEKEYRELEELESLARTAGCIPFEKIIQIRNKPDARYFIGKGKAGYLKNLDVDIILFNESLSPSQVSNLEELTGKKILDRRDIILDIFAQHAKTKASKIEVELAQLEYRLTRLKGSGDNLSRPGGGIGTRGPGEKKLEVDRRKIRDRIKHLKDELSKIKRTRDVQRKRRNGMFTVALLGYTNAGKTTLLNQMTHAGAKADNRLFVTLDPLTRTGMTRNGNKFLITDTVGFIRGIPTELMASFRSTLEEAIDANLRLILVDASSKKYKNELRETTSVMKDLDIYNLDNVMIFNKIDEVYDSVVLENMKEENKNALFISARDKTGFDKLYEKIDAYKKRFRNKRNSR